MVGLFFKKTSRVAATKKDFLERCRTCWIRKYYSPLAIDQALAPQVLSIRLQKIEANEARVATPE
jgi:hypothetical protein